MLIHARTLLGLQAVGLDGPVGKIRDIFFDDRHWKVRYVALRTGVWPFERDVLLPPRSIQVTDWTFHTVGVRLPTQEVETAPRIDQDLPVSRQEEIRLHQHQGTMLGLPCDGFSRLVLVPTATADRELTESGEPALKGSDPHLRSCTAVRGYSVRLDAGSLLGHVVDYVLDLGHWRISYVVVERGRWPWSRRLLLLPEVIRKVSWHQQAIDTRLVPAGPQGNISSPTHRRRSQKSLTPRKAAPGAPSPDRR